MNAVFKAFHIQSKEDISFVCSLLGFNADEDNLDLEIGQVYVAGFGNNNYLDYGIFSEEEYKRLFEEGKKIENGFYVASTIV